MAEDDFIEEDNGVSGYADNGMEDWDRSEASSDEEEKGKVLFNALSGWECVFGWERSEEHTSELQSQ